MNGERLAAAVNEIALRGLSGRLFAGAAIRVERGGETLYDGAFGQAIDTAGRREPMTVSTKFDIASLTKIFTTTAALRLLTLGEIDIDMALRDIEAMAGVMERHPLVEKAFASITIKELLTHSSGLHYWYPFYAARRAMNGAGADFGSILEEVLERFPLGAGTVYSDLNFMLLGKIVEAASGVPLDRALGELVCEPLGLKASGYHPRSGPFAATEFGNRIEMKMVEDLGLSFSGWRDIDSPFVGEPDDGNCHYYFGDVAGHAGIFSTVADICALGRLYLDSPRQGGYIEPALIADAALDHGGNRGLGFQLGVLYPRGGFGHTGFTGTYLYLNREEELAVAVFANRLHVKEPRNINEFRIEIVNAVIGSS